MCLLSVKGIREDFERRKKLKRVDLEGG